MKKIVIFLMVIFTLISCRSSKSLITQTQEYKGDSVRVEYRERTVFVPDTVFLEIPAQTAERTTRDSVSHLENEYATSDARINTDGSLFHDLRTKPQKKAIETDKKIEKRDCVVYRDRYLKVKEKVSVPRDLTKFQKCEIFGFWFLLAIFALVVCLKRLQKQ
jgi:hypothetical protein